MSQCCLLIQTLSVNGRIYQCQPPQLSFYGTHHSGPALPWYFLPYLMLSQHSCSSSPFDAILLMHFGIFRASSSTVALTLTISHPSSVQSPFWVETVHCKMLPGLHISNFQIHFGQPIILAECLLTGRALEFMAWIWFFPISWLWMALNHCSQFKLCSD